jgi:regulator of RNase E activity RraB
MNTVSRLIVAFFLFFSITEVAHAEKQPAHIVFSFDHSGSMVDSGNLAIQIEGVSAALEQYVTNCTQVRVSYIAWGSYSEDPVSVLINDRASREAFTETLRTKMRFHRIRGTLHRTGIMSAFTHIRNTPASYSAIIFVTDEHGMSFDSGLPERTMLFKISLGSILSKLYVAERFMPKVGYTKHAQSPQDITDTINEVFGIMTDSCVG